uniref:Uncharacterized protein n=1 Tax=Cacopsylla melanoneura TaxID=428564 RepID=A0A8D9BI10_9HEMI
MFLFMDFSQYKHSLEVRNYQITWKDIPSSLGLEPASSSFRDKTLKRHCMQYVAGVVANFIHFLKKVYHRFFFSKSSTLLESNAFREAIKEIKVNLKSKTCIGKKVLKQLIIQYTSSIERKHTFLHFSMETKV